MDNNLNLWDSQGMDSLPCNSHQWECRDMVNSHLLNNMDSHLLNSMASHSLDLDNHHLWEECQDMVNHNNQRLMDNLSQDMDSNQDSLANSNQVILHSQWDNKVIIQVNSLVVILQILTSNLKCSHKCSSSSNQGNRADTHIVMEAIKCSGATPTHTQEQLP